MNITWALVTPSKRLVITDSSFRKLKLIQMLVSKSVILDVIRWGENLTVGTAEINLHDKIKFIKDIIDVEDDSIDNLSNARNNDGLKDLLGSVKEFYSLVYPEDSTVAELIDIELKELDGWVTAPIKHKSFIFQALHNIDYLLDLDSIKTSIREAVKNPPHDDYYVYEHLNLSMTNFLDSNK